MDYLLTAVLFTLSALVMLAVGIRVLVMIPTSEEGSEYAPTLRWLRFVALGVILMALFGLLAGALILPIGTESELSMRVVRWSLVAENVVGAGTTITLFVAYSRLFGDGTNAPTKGGKRVP